MLTFSIPRAFLVLSLIVLAAPRPVWAEPPGEPRLAFVVATTAEPDENGPSAALDGGLISAALADDGFGVTALLDPDKDRLDRGLRLFLEKVRQAGPRAIVFVYVQGRALQYGGDTYLLPISAHIRQQSDVPVEGIPLATLTVPIQNLPAIGRMFVFNLARAGAPPTPEPLPLAAGLALPQVSPGSLYAFNAAPGALDVPDTALYGRYAKALNEALRQPGLSPSAMFERVRMRVAAATDGKVVPWSASTLDAALRLAPPPAQGAVATESPAEDWRTPEAAFWTAVRRDNIDAFQAFLAAFGGDRMAPRVRHWLALRREATLWRDVRAVDRPEAYWTFMRLYPRGPHYVDVRRRLAAMGMPLAPPPRYEPYALASPLPEGDEWRTLDAGEPHVEDEPDAPSPPGEFLQPPAREAWLDLPPPLPVPDGVLHVPPPIAAAGYAPGLIEQILVPGLGTVRFQRKGRGLASRLVVEGDAGLILRCETRHRADGWEAVETDAADEPQARLTARRVDASRTVFTETNGRGAYLADLRIGVDPLGGSWTVLRDDRLRIVWQTRHDRWGVLRESHRGSGTEWMPSLEVPRETEVTAPATPASVPPASTATPAAPVPPAVPPLVTAEPAVAPLPVPRPSDLRPSQAKPKSTRSQAGGHGA